MTMTSTSSDCSYGPRSDLQYLIRPEAMGRLDLLLKGTLPMLAQINSSNIGIGLLEPDGSIAYIFTYQGMSELNTGPGHYYSPSISFQAFKKSSGSENATKPNFAW